MEFLVMSAISRLCPDLRRSVSPRSVRIIAGIFDSLYRSQERNWNKTGTKVLKLSLLKRGRASLRHLSHRTDSFREGRPRVPVVRHSPNMSWCATSSGHLSLESKVKFDHTLLRLPPPCSAQRYASFKANSSPNHCQH
jgi:hypothetical protein